MAADPFLSISSEATVFADRATSFLALLNG